MIPWRWRDVAMVLLWIIVGTLGAVILAIGALVATGGLVDPEQVDANLPIWLFALVSAVVYAVLIWAVYRRTVKRYELPWSSLGLNGFASTWIWSLPFLLLLQLFGAAAVNLLVIAPLMGGEFENPQIEMITGGQMPAPSDFLSLMLVIAILAPIAEELFFRGMLYPLLRRNLSVWPAIFLNAALFSLIHFIPVLLPALFIVGLMLAWVREKSGSVIPCMILHCMQNALAVFSIYTIMSQV